jgi:large subunit ribosomal protein L11
MITDTSYFYIFCRPGHDTAGTVHVKHIYEIAKIKTTDEHLSRIDLQMMSRSIVGSARSMGLKIVKD